MTILTSDPVETTDHVWFRNLVTEEGNEDTFEIRQEFRAACELAFDTLRPSLDPNFIKRFRTQTPNAASELLFGMACVRAGWTLAPRTPRFDFTFTRPDFDGRLLVEVTTPAAPPSTAWEEETIKSGARLRRWDQSSKDAAMTRLTSGFKTKAEIVQEAIDLGFVRAGDYRVIALGGARLSAEMGWTAIATGSNPDYAPAFLPIGPLTIPITVDRQFKSPPKAGEAHHIFSGEIPRGDKESVSREYFASDRFPHVDAVMFSPVSVNGFGTPELQSSTLHNPFSDFVGKRPMINLGADYTVSVTDDALIMNVATSRG